MQAGRHARFLASALVLAALVGEGLLLLAHLVNRAAFDTRMLDFEQEANLPTWLSGAQFLLAAVAALVAVGVVDRRPAKLAWLAVAGLAAAMSVDEVAEMHEVAGRRIGETATLSLMQPLLAAAAVALLLAAAAAATRRPALVLRLACVLLVASQVCASVEGLAAAGPAVFALETVEDVTEALTATLLLVAALEATGIAVRLQPRALADGARAWWAASPARSR